MITFTRKELVRQLLDDFNFYRGHTKSIIQRREQHPVNDWAAKPDRLAMLDDLVTWCQERSLQPRFWIYHLFAARRWRYPPDLKRGHLFSENLTRSYHYQRASQFYTERLEDTAHVRRQAEDQAHDNNLELSVGTETLKRSYAKRQAWQLCMADMQETYGYHPLSKVCQECPVAEPCEAQLRTMFPFDIVAARRGDLKMTSRMAQEMVWRTHAGGR